MPHVILEWKRTLEALKSCLLSTWYVPDILLCTENITVNLIILGLIEFFYFITYWSFKKKKNNCTYKYILWPSLGAKTVKNLPAMQETWVWSLGQEGSLEQEVATHSNILAWRIPWTEEPGGLQSTGSQRVGHAWATNTQTRRDLEIGFAEITSFL